MTSKLRAARRCDKIFAHDRLPPALDRLDHWRLPHPRGSHPRKLGSPSATAGASCQTTSSPPVDGTQTVLDCPARNLVGMERTAYPRDAENGRRLASGGLPAVLEMAVTSQTSGRQKAREQGDPGLDLPHGG